MKTKYDPKFQKSTARNHKHTTNLNHMLEWKT